MIFPQPRKPSGKALRSETHLSRQSCSNFQFRLKIPRCTGRKVPTLESASTRGSSGYGSAFERAGNDEQRARDVVAASDYAHSVLGGWYDRIVVLGHSYGATIALAAGLPDHMGIFGSGFLAGLAAGLA